MELKVVQIPDKETEVVEIKCHPCFADSAIIFSGTRICVKSIFPLLVHCLGNPEHNQVTGSIIHSLHLEDGHRCLNCRIATSLLAWACCGLPSG